ncbi:MAG: YdeI/OmpD-associated family protein [Gemmatimonadota bacterium]|nr:YdeI/OmpD-associated family protein [Gemmatimonadota bacterium]MDE2872616.1 YdeI/OmpD-associated family protein [Gemmatimonadota bacterium]
MSPSYRRQVTWWVVSAKREETRERRLQDPAGVLCGGSRDSAIAGNGAETDKRLSSVD